MSEARALLESLLRRAERAHRRGEARAVACNLASVEGYAALRTLAQLEAFHAEIALAERAGALRVQRAIHHGDGQQLRRLEVHDAAALARHLGVVLLEDRVDAAEAVLAPWRSRFPVLDEVLALWRAGRKLRGAGPEAAAELADAARAAAARLEDAGGERILRRESVRLFGDSKRLEKLTGWLELLATNELAASGLEEADVWALFGLRREPQPLLLAARGTATVGDTELPLPAPFIGLPLESLRALRTGARYLLSIENLASFHDAARAPGAERGLLVYTGGMPSPAWRAAYVRILADLPAQAPVFHWGDIDEGGFRIAAKLAETAAAAGRSLRPWRMSPDGLPDELRARAARPDAARLERMRGWAIRAGWGDLADALLRAPLLLEQEHLPARLPELPGE
ncbi:MAG TPA: DUF2220 family protein [Chiayiivirga sp.]|nr:DUF2220 family protein [Chiayiivirga sp.]